MLNIEKCLNLQSWVEGEEFYSSAAERFATRSPYSGEHYADIPRGCPEDVDKAVASARQAYTESPWKKSPSLRKNTLTAFARLIEENASALDILDADEMGKPVSIGFGSALAAAGLVRFCAEAVDKLEGKVFNSCHSTFVANNLVPYGVVGAIAPWNFPSYNAVLKSVPALAAGNCVVLKPSEMSSQSAIWLAKLAYQAGIPKGVFNIVLGVGETIGRALALHHDVDMLTFTGSSSVGKLIMQYAGQSNMKPVMTECGGKSPQIVFDDGVDLDVVADFVTQSIVMNQGQVCSAGSRLLVQKSIESPLLERIARKMKAIVVGDPANVTTTFGPIVSEKQLDKILDYIATAKDQGAELVQGGNRVKGKSGGYFIEPTLFKNVCPDTDIAQQEIFGPVLSVISFDTLEQALHIANGTIYGLGAYAWTENINTGMTLIRELDCSVIINSAPMVGEGAGHALTTEPAKQSGLGPEGGMTGIESYMRRQLVWFNHG